MANKYLDLAGLQRLVNKIKELIPTRTSELENDKGFITIEDIPGGETKITIRHQERFIVGASSVFEFTKGYYTLNANSVNWYLDGIKQSNDTLIEINNRTIEVVGGLPQGSTVVFDYFEYTNTTIGLEGPQGPKGVEGDKGDTGLQGIQGIQGVRGKNIEYLWNGTQLGVKVEGESNYSYTNLKGDKGDKGDQGIQGLKGDTGSKGETGNKGDSIEFLWNGAQLGVRIEGQTIYSYMDLKGDQGIEGLKGDKGDTGEQGPPGEAIADSIEWSKILNKPSLVTQKTITSATEPTLNVGDQWHREM